MITDPRFQLQDPLWTVWIGDLISDSTNSSKMGILKLRIIPVNLPSGYMLSDVISLLEMFAWARKRERKK